MPKENFLITHWQAEKDCFGERLDTLNAHDPEQIHKIRVSIKKLRVYLHLYFVLCKNRNLKFLFSDTEDLFTLLGKHRNIEVSMQQAGEDMGNAPVFEYYLAWLQLMKNKLPSLVDAFSCYNSAGLAPLTRAIKNRLEHVDNVKLGRRISRINKHFLEKIRVNMRHFRHNFHEIRKDLKSIYYVSVISPEVGFSKKQLTRLDKILDLLGDIQNDEVLLQFIHQYFQTAPDKFRDQLKTADQRIKNRKSGMLQKARNRTRQFLKRLTE